VNRENGVRVELDESARLDLLLHEYGHFAADAEGFCRLLGGLVELRGRATVKAWQALSREGRWAEVFAALMQQHNDPLYERSLHSSYKQFAQSAPLVLHDADAATLLDAARRLMA
jgi:tRNA 2-selenouridine synthase